MTKYFGTPFANTGDKTPVPDGTQGDGSVSYNQGYGPFYQLDPNVDPNGLNIDRQEFNQVLFDMTDAIKDVQEMGILTYRNDVNYPANNSFVVGSDFIIYRALIANGPASSVVNPVGDMTGTWTEAFSTVAPTGRQQWPTVANATDAAHDITFSTGSILSSDSDRRITLSSALTKQIDATWAAGNNAGGLFSGTVAANTTYHCFLIVRDTDGAVEAGFDTSLTAANIPTGYTDYRRIASIITDSSANIIAFTQSGNFFALNSRIQDLSASTLSTTGASVSLSVPSGLVVTAQIKTFLNVNSSSHRVNIEPMSGSNPVPNSNATSILFGGISTTVAELPVVVMDLPTNVSSQIRYRSSQASADEFSIVTLGWTDERIA